MTHPPPSKPPAGSFLRIEEKEVADLFVDLLEAMPEDKRDDFLARHLDRYADFSASAGHRGAMTLLRVDRFVYSWIEFPLEKIPLIGNALAWVAVVLAVPVSMVVALFFILRHKQ